MINWKVVTRLLSFSFMNRRVLSTNPYVGSTANGYAHPSGTALHYDDVPCISGSVSAPRAERGQPCGKAGVCGSL